MKDSAPPDATVSRLADPLAVHSPPPTPHSPLVSYGRPAVADG